LDEVVVSLDGSCAEIHERTRGKGSFEPAVEGIGNLVRHNRVSTYTTVSRLNYGDLEGIVRLGLDLGAVSMKFNEVLPLGQGAIHRDDLVLTNEERREVAQRLHDLNAGSGGRIVGSFLVMLDFYAPFEDLDQGTLSLSPEYRDPNCLTSCAGGVSKCAVRPDGAVIPCDRLWDLTAGNILTEELSGIWHSSPVFEAMRRRQRFSLGDLETCRPCGYNPLCSGGCPAVAYSLTGSVFGRDPMSCYGIYKGGGTPYSPVPPGAKPGLPGEALGSAPGTEPPGRP